MALVGVSARAGVLSAPGAAGEDLKAYLHRHLDGIAGDAPVIVLIHGFRYHPDIPRADPHRLLFAPADLPGRRRIRSWSEGLGFGQEPGRDGLCIGFAWEALDTGRAAYLSHWTGFNTAYHRAAEAGRALAGLMHLLAEIAPARKVDILAHSLGARVALQALGHLHTPTLGRVILMGGAEYASATRHALEANRANAQAEFVNVTARENDLYDMMFETVGPRSTRDDTALGAGLADAPSGWLDLQVDHSAIAAILAARGVHLAPVTRRITHCGFYTRRGMFALYRGLIRNRPEWNLATLRAETAGIAPEPRWSRLRRGWLSRA